MAFKSIISVTCACLAVVSFNASSAIVDVSDFNGKGYFRDQSTGLLWQDIDNFWSPNTYNDIASALQGTGFHIATLSELQTLQGSVGASPSTFASDVVIMGGNLYSRQMLWGVYNDGNVNDGVSYSWRTDTDNSWSYISNQVDPNEGLTWVGVNVGDLGAFVVADSVNTVVPVPAAVWLFGSGLLGLIGIARRKKA